MSSVRFGGAQQIAVILHNNAGIAQLVERLLAKQEVASSSLVSRSKFLALEPDGTAPDFDSGID